MPLVTCRLSTASTTLCGAGTGAPGPIHRLRYTPLTIGRAHDPFRQRHPENPADRLDQFIRPDRAVRVTQSPEELRIAQVARGEQIEPIALLDAVLSNDSKPI